MGKEWDESEEGIGQHMQNSQPKPASNGNHCLLVGIWGWNECESGQTLRDPKTIPSS